MNPFDVPTPPKKQSKEEYEDMFPSGQQNHAARMYAEDDDDSPWSQEQQRNTRYTQSAEYHRSIESDLRSASNGVASVASEGYYGRNEYEEEEEEEVDEVQTYQTRSTNSYDSAIQTQSTTNTRQRDLFGNNIVSNGGGGGMMNEARSSIHSGGSISPSATSPNPLASVGAAGRASQTSSLRASISAESYKSFGNRLRNVVKQSQEHGSRVKAKNDARVEEIAMNRRYKGGVLLLQENQRQEVTMAASYGTLDAARDERQMGPPPGIGGGQSAAAANAGVVAPSPQKKPGFFARRRGVSSESVDRPPPEQTPEQIKSKKSLAHKMRSLQRRTGQMMLEGVGVVERPKDEDFNNLWKRVQKSDKTLQQISKESAKFLAALKAVSVHSKQISTLLLQYAEGEEGEDPRNQTAVVGVYEDAAFRKQKDLVIEKATKLLDVTRSIDDRIIPMCSDAMEASFMAIRDKRMEQFPPYNPCVDKRVAYMRDMDAYERRLEAAQQAKKKDMEYIDKSKRKAELSQSRFQNFSSRLVEDLVLFDASRFETCGELVDTFAESLIFTADREREILQLVSASGGGAS